MAKEKINDGGEAFPRPIGHVPNNGASYSESQRGMSLRDYFAAKAMQGWLSTYGSENTHPDVNSQCDIVAKDAYAMADAMIKARGK